MKLKNVKSQYSNPDKLIKTLRKKLDRQEDVNIELIENEVRFEMSVKKRFGRVVMNWENTINVQSIAGLFQHPREIHVGEHITQSGRIIEVLEKLTEKGEPITTFKYELKQTRIVPNIETSPEVT